MRYDIELIHQLCREIGLSARKQSDRRVDIDLGGDAILSFQNAEAEDDCLVGFLSTPWHAHGDLIFAALGNYVELDCLEIVAGLKEGRVLICERQVEGRTLDRWLTHSECNDEFKYLEEREQIVVRRAVTHPVGASRT